LVEFDIILIVPAEMKIVRLVMSTKNIFCGFHGNRRCECDIVL